MLLGMACGDSGTDPVAIPANAIVVEAGPVEGLLYHFRWNSGIEARERIVIRDASAWTALWERMNDRDCRNHRRPLCTRNRHKSSHRDR